MAKVFRRGCKIILVTLVLIAIYFFATYRDYTAIYNNKSEKRDTTILIVVHHDGVDRETSVNEVQVQHKEINKWESGFAYHFYLIDGKIIQMHKLSDATGHAFGFNRNSVAVCVHQQDKYKVRTRVNLWATIFFLKIRYNLSSHKISGHGELPDQNGTRCPDMNMDSLRDMFIEFDDVKRWIKQLNLSQSLIGRGRQE